MVLDVKGHSGCDINIVNYNKNIAIEKSTNSVSYFDRLKNQIKKQEHAYSILNGKGNIYIPEIYKTTYSDNKVSMIMEYIYSKNFMEYFEYATKQSIDNLSKFLTNFIDYEISNSTLVNVDKSIVINKWNSVKAHIESNEHINKNDKVKQIVNKCQKIFTMFNESQKQLYLPIGMCHGDLTFSNILFSNDNYYIIDFLDSFIESPLLDIVKIRQDTKYGWSALMYTKSYDKIRFDIICKKIDNYIDEYFNQTIWYADNYNIFQLMNFLRVIQYAKEDNVINYLISTINDIINEYEKN